MALEATIRWEAEARMRNIARLESMMKGWRSSIDVVKKNTGVVVEKLGNIGKDDLTRILPGHVICVI